MPLWKCDCNSISACNALAHDAPHDDYAYPSLLTQARR
jgi:hypothetical protein